jgi:hypothetical protein
MESMSIVIDSIQCQNTRHAKTAWLNWIEINKERDRDKDVLGREKGALGSENDKYFGKNGDG